MSNPTIRIHDLATNEIIDREMNDEELASWKADKTATEAQSKSKAELATQRQALLSKLGITEEEAKLLLS